MSRRRIQIFDTTLRDGEQSPGIALRPHDKAEIAGPLERLRVDVVEAGFAAASPGDFEGVRAVAEAVSAPTVASLARSRKDDLDAAGQALAKATRPRVHIVLGTSPLHMEKKLGLEPQEVVEQAAWSVAYAAQLVDEVEFACEDATRSDPRSSRASAVLRSVQGRRSSTSPTRSATRYRPSTRRSSQTSAAAARSSATSRCPSTATTTSASRSRTRSRACKPARRRWSARSMGSVGVRTTLPLGKHSGRHAFAKACGERGVQLAKHELDAAFRRLKEHADPGGVVAIEDLLPEVAA